MYALSVTIFGGTTQFVVAWLIDFTKNPLVPAWYQIIANVGSIIAIALLKAHSDTRSTRHSTTVAFSSNASIAE